MPRPHRDEQQADMQTAIKSTAWKLIAQDGAPALSLRAIARELKITAPAIYNYYPRRDDLVTALIVDAFTSLGDAQFVSAEQNSPAGHTSRLVTLGLAYRQWAITYPERYQLIFGTPIAGYEAPGEITTPAAARALSVIMGVLAEAFAAGEMLSSASPPLPEALRSMLTAWQIDRVPDMPMEVLFATLTIWACVHGMVSLEIGGQYPPYITDAGELYRCQVEILVAQILAQN